MVKLSAFVAAVVVGLICSTLAFRSLSSNRSFFDASSAASRMTSQHMTIQYVGTALRADDSAPPPPVPHAVDSPPPSSPSAAVFSTPGWMTPAKTYLSFNAPAKASLAPHPPHGTTVHFTFGSSVMMDFVKNWVHFVQKAQLTPFLIGAADLPLLRECTRLGLPAAGIDPSLDVWTYQRKPGYGKEVYEMKSEWKYFRHHNSDFLEMGLVKVAFLWELLSAGFNVLISDLDVVWLNGHWQRWMTWADPLHPPVPQAALIALADVLVTTDELSAKRDAQGGRLGGMHTELNTGVVHFRATPGAKAMVQQWRKSMLSQKGRRDLDENVNDQSLFNQVVRGQPVSDADLARMRDDLNASSGVLRHCPPGTFSRLAPDARVVHLSHAAYPPCLPTERCAPSKFSFGTLPMRPFTGGHTWFNQNVQQMEGHQQPQHEPITVHFTFQFGDTGDYPHGKRQRAREAGLWAVDPPEYFTEGVFVALDGSPTDPAHQAAVYARFPEWSPQRHMHMDAPQRQAVRDLLGLATAMDGIVVLPKLFCHCDRYWGFLSNCRFPHVPEMGLPFNCPMDANYDTQRWNKKGVRFREHTFLDNPHVPERLRQNTVRVIVAPKGEAVPSGGAEGAREVRLAYGTSMAAVRAAVLAANPSVRVIRIANADLRRLCRSLGSAETNRKFNTLTRYILTESSRYCPQEDMGGYGAPGFDWQNPYTAYNCTWGFHAPTPFPEEEEAVVCPAGGRGGSGTDLVERSNSTTCPRQMLCDYNTLPDGRETKPITWCNIEGYNGMRSEYLGATRAMLAKMPGGRCPYPPGDRPGMPGFDTKGHFVKACPPLTWCRLSDP